MRKERSMLKRKSEDIFRIYIIEPRYTCNYFLLFLLNIVVLRICPVHCFKSYFIIIELMFKSNRQFCYISIV